MGFELIGSRIAFNTDQNPDQAVVMDLKSMKREKTLLAASPIQSFELNGNKLSLVGSNSVDVYNIQTLRRISSSAANRNSRQDFDRRNQQPSGMLRDGHIAEGVLWDNSKRRPKLLVSSLGLLRITSSRTPETTSFLRRVKPRVKLPAGAKTLRTPPHVVVAKAVNEESGLQGTLYETLYTLDKLDSSNRATTARVQLALVVAGADGQTVATTVLEDSSSHPSRAGRYRDGKTCHLRLREQTLPRLNPKIRKGIRGVPMAVPIGIKVTDEDGAVAELRYFVLVDLPMSVIQKAVMSMAQ